jgi:hypothetical protein
MARTLSTGATRALLYRYFLSEGWLPAGTTESNFLDVSVTDLGFDKPAMPHAPNLQKDRAGLDLQSLFYALGSRIPSPTVHLRSKTLTLAGLATKIHDSQKG